MHSLSAKFGRPWDSVPFTGGVSSPQASSSAVKLDARELGERLAADAWAAADRLLLCLCLRAWRLQRGRVAVKSPTPPLQGAVAAPRVRFAPTERVADAGKKPERRDEDLLQRYLSAWKDQAASLVRAKLEEQRPLPFTIQERGATPSASASWKVQVDLTDWEQPPSPQGKVSSGEGILKATQQRLADAEQALAESLWFSQQGQRMSKLEVRLERHLRTQELLQLRLTWQAWEELVKDKARPPEVAGLPMQSWGVRGVHSWESLGFEAKAKTQEGIVPGHGIQGWIRERSDLHMHIQSLREQLDTERRMAKESASSAQLAVEALQEELLLEKEKLRTKAVLQRAYLQSEISSQDAERMKAERALEAVRRRSLAKLIHPRLLRKSFYAWARTFRQTVEAVSMLMQLPSSDSPRRLRFLIEDAERGSFSKQLGHWLEDPADPRNEEELICDSRDLLKDQAKAAISNMGKIMEQANAMWEAVRLRIQLFRGFSISRCQALEHQGLLTLIVFCWARHLRDLQTMRLALRRCTARARPFELAEYFYLWHALTSQSSEMEKVLGRTMRGSLALSSAGGGFSNSDLVKMTFNFWQLHIGFAQRTRRFGEALIWRHVPSQESAMVSDVFLVWLITARASISERESSEATSMRRSSIQVTVEMAPESPANAPPRPHPAPERPERPRISMLGDLEATGEETDKELRLVTEAVEKAGVTMDVQHTGANTYQIGDKSVQVQIRGEQVLVKQGQAFIPIAKFLAGPQRVSRAAAGAASGSVTPPGGRTPRSEAKPKSPAKSPARSPARSPPSPKAQATQAAPGTPGTPRGPTARTSGAPGASRSPGASPKAPGASAASAASRAVIPTPKAPKASPKAPPSPKAKAPPSPRAKTGPALSSSFSLAKAQQRRAA